VTHPGLVLGDYAAREFDAVDTALKTAEYSEGHTARLKAPSVVVSSADNSITVFDNGAVAAKGKVEIENPEQPLGERVFLLNGENVQDGSLAWSGAEVGSLTKSVGDDSATVLRRIKAEPKMREAVRTRLGFGMTLVTTDEPATASTRSGDGFVIIDAVT
jgi:hypothetical protein